MKTHEEYWSENTAENYVLGKLSKSDMILFEEHMLLCDICAEEVRRLTATMDMVENSALIPDTAVFIQDSLPEKTSNSLNTYLKIAAGIAVLMALSWFSIWFFALRKTEIISENKQINPVEKVVAKETDTVQTKNLIAVNTNMENFVKLDRFESQINQEYRSVSIDNVTPKNGQQFKTGTFIRFEWKKQGIESLVMVIYNNKGKIIFQKDLKTDVISKKIFKPGLYYWQLETDDDIVYTGKFTVSDTK